jgi:predicted nucleotidyltransferase
MMPINRTHIKRIKELAKAYGATRLILFGSAVDMPKKARDIDIACDGIPGWKLYEFAAKVEDELKVSLDIVPLSPPTRFTRSIEKKGRVLI